MLTREETECRLREFLAQRPERIAAAYLFGSMARGTAGPSSDVDVGILLEEDPPRTLEGLLLDLECNLSTRLDRPAQVVVLNRAPVELVHHVLRDGILVLERDAAARVHFEVRARREYFDLRPILDRYRRIAVSAGLGE